MTNELSSWWEIAKYAGAGATFVLGVVLWKLWPSYQDEVKYSKQRDRETLDVLVALTKVVNDAERRSSEVHNQNTEGIKAVLVAINRLSETIQNHLLKRLDAKTKE